MLPPDWRVVFLSEYARTGNVRMASDLAGVSYRTAYNYRRMNDRFAADWDIAFACFIAAKRRVVKRQYAYQLTG